MPPFFQKIKKICFLSRYTDNKSEKSLCLGMLWPAEGYTTPLVGFMIFTKWDRSIYPPRPCCREVTELRTAYPHHGNLTPPRISPSRFREYHCHPGCHRLHEKLSHGL